MPTLNIGGQSVNVGDEFLKLSPEQQDSTVDEIAQSLKQSQIKQPNLGIQGEILHGMPIVGPLLERAAALTGAGIQGLTGSDKSFGQRYGENLKNQQIGHQQYEAEHPIASPIAQMGGAALSLVPAGATSLGGSLLGLRGNLFQRAMGGAAGGAAINSADAALRNEDPQMAALAGGAIGAGLPVVGAIGSGIGRAAKTALQPFTKGGQEARANQIISQFSEGAPTVPARPAILGAEPTFAQATANPGLAGLERTMRNMPGDIGAEFTRRDAANAAARDVAYANVSGDQASLDALQQARDQIKPSFLTGVRANTSKVAEVVKKIDDILASPAGQRDAVSSAMNSLRDKLVQKGKLQTDPAQLYGIRKAAGDMMKFNLSPQKLASGELKEVQRTLDKAIEDAVPGFKTYLRDYAEASKPIDVQELLQQKNVTAAGGNITVAKIDNAIKSIEAMRVKAGANKGKSLSDNELNQLRALREDLRMAQNTNLGRAPGSNTVQNLMAGNALGGFLRSHIGGGATGAVLGGATDMMSGRPPSLGTIAGGAAGGLLGGRLKAGDEAIMRKVAEKMLSPQEGQLAILANHLRTNKGRGVGLGRIVNGGILGRALTPPSSPNSN